MSAVEPMDDLEGRKTLLHASGLRGGRVLDVGIGECACMSLYLAGKGFDVVGIDRSPKAVHDSRMQARARKLQSAFQVRLADAQHLPFVDSEFDAVVAYHSLHHMRDALKVLDEMFRVCRKGGLVLVSEPHEVGRKTYGHRPDDGGLLKTLKEMLAARGKIVSKVRTTLDLLFVCKKPKG